VKNLSYLINVTYYKHIELTMKYSVVLYNEIKLSSKKARKLVTQQINPPQLTLTAYRSYQEISGGGYGRQTAEFTIQYNTLTNSDFITFPLITDENAWGVIVAVAILPLDPNFPSVFKHLNYRIVVRKNTRVTFEPESLGFFPIPPIVQTQKIELIENSKKLWDYLKVEDL
jgi:hypothetical protein